MICIALGLGVLGYIAARKARRCHAYHHGFRHGFHDHWGWHHHPRGPGGRRRMALHMALARIDATPAQERAIVAEVDRLEERLYTARAGLQDGRADLASALRGPTLDDAALGSVLGRVDGATADARSAILEALRNIHAILDDKQRAQLADLLDGGWWRHGAGPYRR